MLAPTGTPLQAVVSGFVEHHATLLGGVTLSLLGDNGNRYYYAHLSAYEGAAGRVEQASGHRLRRRHRERDRCSASALRDPPEPRCPGEPDAVGARWPVAERLIVAESHVAASVSSLAVNDPDNWRWIWMVVGVSFLLGEMATPGIVLHAPVRRSVRSSPV